MPRVLIDGYNLLAEGEHPDRDSLVRALSTYHKNKGIDVTIVFDGTHKDTFHGDRYHDGGIEVIFSPITVTADEVIEEILSKPSSGDWIVVSSDRRIQSAARHARATFVNSPQFLAKLTRRGNSLLAPKEVPPWMEGRLEERADQNPPKGKPSKKRSKDERRRAKKMDKL